MDGACAAARGARWCAAGAAAHAGDPETLPVDSAERLKNPADGDWPMFRRTYDGWGYSPLSQINADNVQRLQPAWVFSTGVVNGHEAPPVVVNGVMFVRRRATRCLPSMRRRARCCGGTAARSRRPSCCCIRQAAASLSTTTRCILRPAKPCSSRWMQKPERKHGRLQWRTTRAATTCRSRRSSPTGKCWSELRAANSASVAMYPRSTPKPAKSSGRPTWYRRPASLEAKPGQRVTNGKPAAVRCGSRRTTIRRRISPSGARVTAARGSATGGRAITCTSVRRLPSMSRPARSRATCSTTRTNRGIGTKCRRRF